MRHLYYASIIFLFLSACHANEKNNNNPNAGVISYLIEYPDTLNNTVSASVMPRLMRLSFLNNQIKINIKGSLNIFSLSFINNSPQDSSLTTFKLMENELTAITPVNKQFFFYSNNKKPHISYVDNDTKVIAGFNCKKAIVKFENSQPFTTYYTQEITLDNPNRNTHLQEIPGVLMKFCLDYNHIRFQFTATEFNNTKPSPSEFEIPKITKRHSQKEIETLISTLITSFQ